MVVGVGVIDDVRWMIEVELILDLAFYSWCRISGGGLQALI